MAGRYDITTGRANKIGPEPEPEKKGHPEKQPHSRAKADNRYHPNAPYQSPSVGQYELISPGGNHIRFTPVSFDLNVTYEPGQADGRVVPIGHVNISFSAPIDQLQGITH